MGSTHTTPSTRRRLVGLALAGLLALAACGGDDDAATEPAADESAAYEPADEPAERAADDTDAGDSLAIGGGRAGESGDVGIDLGTVGRDVIIEMYVTMSSDDIQRSVAAVTAKASALGGGVASSDVNYPDPVSGGETGGYAVLVVKVPPAAIDDLMTGLEQAGTIRSISQSAQDVTEQLVDLDVRIANARESVENVRAFMERTENLSELVTLEGELTRRQTELERLEAQQRNLSERVALSTVTVEIVPTASVPEPPDEDDSIGDAFRTGWDGFVTLLWGIGYLFAVLLPFLVLALLAGGIAWGVVRRRRRPVDRAPVSPADPGGDDDATPAD